MITQRDNNNLNILIQTYDTAFQNVAGGVHNRILRTVEAIRKIGVNVDYFNKFTTIVNRYDILHVFMLEISNLGLMKYAKAKGMKIVLSAVVGLDKAANIDFYWKIRKIPVMTTYKLLFQMCELADAIIAETKKEADFIVKHYHVMPEKIFVIPNGADTPETDSQMIFDVIGKRCPYALEVARFDKNKNQINVIRGVKGTNIEVVFAGGADFSDNGYYEECLELASDSPNIHFLGWLDTESELLKSAYVNAKVLVVSSFHETFGLSIVEGAMAGAVPVISKTLPILDYDVFHNCITIDPNNPEHIRRQLEKAMLMENTPVFRAKIQEVFSWNNVAEQHLKLYRSLANDSY